MDAETEPSSLCWLRNVADTVKHLPVPCHLKAIEGDRSQQALRMECGGHIRRGNMERAKWEWAGRAGWGLCVMSYTGSGGEVCKVPSPHLPLRRTPVQWGGPQSVTLIRRVCLSCCTGNLFCYIWGFKIDSSSYSIKKKKSTGWGLFNSIQ